MGMKVDDDDDDDDDDDNNTVRLFFGDGMVLVPPHKLSFVLLWLLSVWVMIIYFRRQEGENKTKNMVMGVSCYFRLRNLCNPSFLRMII